MTITCKPFTNAYHVGMTTHDKRSSVDSPSLAKTKGLLCNVGGGANCQNQARKMPNILIYALDIDKVNFSTVTQRVEHPKMNEVTLMRDNYAIQ